MVGIPLNENKMPHGHIAPQRLSYIATEPHSQRVPQRGGGRRPLPLPPHCVAIELRGYVALWLCSYVAIWPCGYAATWLYQKTKKTSNRYGEISNNFKVSTFQSLKVLQFQSFKVPAFQSFKISHFKISNSQNKLQI